MIMQFLSRLNKKRKKQALAISMKAILKVISSIRLIKIHTNIKNIIM
jgi:hypothetical protein